MQTPTNNTRKVLTDLIAEPSAEDVLESRECFLCIGLLSIISSSSS